jgi:hypothetical protein
MVSIYERSLSFYFANVAQTDQSASEIRALSVE